MSDLYLILRRRLDDVAHDWVEIDGKVLVSARGKKGYSREALGAIIGVVAKTIERYEAQGRVPRALLPRFADALDLEIEEVPAASITVQARRDDHFGALHERLGEVDGKVDRVAAMVEELLRRTA